MSSTWVIDVDGRTYGPYTFEQMRAFAVEGRLSPASLVAADGDGDGGFGAACKDPSLGPLFQPAPPIGERPEGEPTRDSGARAFGQNDTGGGEQPAHFLIVTHMKSGSIAAFEEQIFSMGAAYQIMPQAWALSSTVPIGAIKNILIQKLGKLDNLLVVDATHDKLTWSNLGPEADTRLRRIWIKAPQLSAA
jgi:hypothetical protein